MAVTAWDGASEEEWTALGSSFLILTETNSGKTSSFSSSP